MVTLLEELFNAVFALSKVYIDAAEREYAARSLRLFVIAAVLCGAQWQPLAFRQHVCALLVESAPDHGPVGVERAHLIILDGRLVDAVVCILHTSPAQF